MPTVPDVKFCVVSVYDYFILSTWLWYTILNFTDFVE